jgi:hypothetical protein
LARRARRSDSRRGSAAHGALEIEGLQQALPDLDTRTTVAAPTAAQTAAADRLGAAVTWNRFGTPSSVYKLDGNLATGVQAPTAVGAARSWLGQNAELFGLAGPDDLVLVRDTPLADGGGHAVLLGQAFDNVLAAPDGLVTVAAAGSAASGWNITYASSSLARNRASTNDFTLSPEQAWVQAANAVGQNVSTADVSVAGQKNGWTELNVDGFDDTQAVRKAAFPVPGRKAQAAFQTVVVDGENLGYTQTVDASSGQILARVNTVDHAIDNPVWDAFPALRPTTTVNAFPWGYPSDDTHRHDGRRRPAGPDHAERPADVPRREGQRAPGPGAEPVHGGSVVRAARVRRGQERHVRSCEASAWTRVLVSPPDAFPSVNPRPIAPDMIMRAWRVPTTTATHVLFRVLTNQCSGQPSYQGEEDNDPTFSTDCRVTSLTPAGQVALPARNTDVRAAEVELLSRAPKVKDAAEEKIPGGDD